MANRSFDIWGPPGNAIEGEVEAKVEAKDKIEVEVIISCRRSFGSKPISTI